MIPSINKGWLAPDFLDWYTYSEGGSISKITSEMYSVPHAYVNHASELLITPSSDLCRAFIPHGMTEVLIPESKYAKFIHKGHLVDSGDTARKYGMCGCLRVALKYWTVFQVKSTVSNLIVNRLIVNLIF